jgi:hypothetical protein
MNISPVFELLRNAGSIVINKALMHRLGVNEAIIYYEIVSRYSYFAKEDMLTEDGYFYNTVDDLQLATAIGEKAQNSAIKKLMTLGLIDKKLKGTPARRHFKIIDNMNLILSLIEEGKTVVKELDQKQKERMKQKIQYSKFSSTEKAEVENDMNNISNSSNSNKTELSKINTSTNEKEVVENITVPPQGSAEFHQEVVFSSDDMKEQLTTDGWRNNTNTIILNNNTKKNKEEDNSVLSAWNNTTTILKEQMTEVSFKTWIVPLVALKTENDTLILKAPNEFIKNIILTKFKDSVRKCINLANDSIVDFDIEI